MAITVTTEVLWDQEWLDHLDDRVDSWLTDLTDDVVDFAAGRLRSHAPGSIDEFVTSDGPELEPQLGIIEGMAGVIEDPDEEFVSRRGSQRRAFPLFVDIGTGIFGEFGRPITAFPGHVMGPVEFHGRMTYPTIIAGQEPQDYSGAATRDTNAWLTGKIRASAQKLGKT